MIDLVARWTNGPRANWRVAHYGIRRDTFSPAPGPVTRLIATPADPPASCTFRDHGDQKNLGVLLEAVQQLQQAEPGRYSLRLTAGFLNRTNWGRILTSRILRVSKRPYRTLQAAGVAEDVGGRPHAAVSELYGASDLFVFPPTPSRSACRFSRRWRRACRSWRLTCPSAGRSAAMPRSISRRSTRVRLCRGDPPRDGRRCFTFEDESSLPRAGPVVPLGRPSHGTSSRRLREPDLSRLTLAL